MKHISIIQWRKGGFLFASLLLSLLVISTSCKKKDNLLGGNAIEQEDLLSSSGVDTFTLQTHTIAEDTIRTNSPLYALIGSYNDPEMGVYTSSFYTQFGLQTLDNNFGEDGPITVDSVVLVLQYNNIYGEPSELNFSVNRLDDVMSVDSAYYQNSTLAEQAENLVEPGYEMQEVNPDAITVVGGDTVNPSQLRLRLKNSVGTDFFTAFQNNPEYFADQDLFTTNYFKGLHISATNPSSADGDGAIGYFDYDASPSKLIIYYTEDTESFDYGLLLRSGDFANFNAVEVDKSGTDYEAVVTDSTLGQTQFYAQSIHSRAAIKFPTLRNIPSNVVVHTARLYLPIQYLDGSPFNPGNSLTFITRKNRSLVNFNQSYNAATHEFEADIREYVQTMLIDDEIDSELLFYPTRYITSANRIIFNGPNTTFKQKPRLVLTYTEY